MHTLFLLFLVFFVLCGLFLQSPFYILFHRVPQKQDKTQEYQKQFLYVYHRFSALTSIDCLINLETLNAITHGTKVVGLLFLFLFDIWISYFG
jgi:hypothetical protein